jgi:hypothetical protein
MIVSKIVCNKMIENMIGRLPKAVKVVVIKAKRQFVYLLSASSSAPGEEDAQHELPGVGCTSKSCAISDT